jgi:negative regulator of sigma-B (phosphoserine phosphatase)
LPKLGERVNGDAVLVRPDAQGRLLLAVVDGLGHGPVAGEASRAAVARLQTAALEQSVLELMQALHEELRGTRGAAATICIVRGRKVEACAVGNVQLSSAKANVPLVLSSGVLGQRVPKFRVCEGELKDGARLALFSDGISTRFRLEDLSHLSPNDACKLTIDRHRKNEDDATILIADLT